MSKILIPVAWPYANGPRHIGHVAGFGVPSDVFARYHRMAGNEVLMISGTDEHGTPIVVQAEAAGMQPKEFADLNNEIIVRDLHALGLTYDLFTRTTTLNHAKTVQEIFLGLYKNGYIIEKDSEVAISPSTGRTLPDRYIFGTCPKCGYENARGDQCENCGSQLTPRELKNPHAKTADGGLESPDFKNEAHMFLDLPGVKNALEKWLKSRKDWRPNVIKYALGLLADLEPRAISRDIDWGISIPLPGWQENESKKLYVWFDAVIGYLSASIEWARRGGGKWEDFWRGGDAESFYFMGKDNIVFHAEIWPAILLGYSGKGDKGGEAGEFGELDLPSEIVSSEFLTMNLSKFSTSQGNVIYVNDFLAEFQADALRYFIAAAGPENQDANFTWEEFYGRVNSELVGNWGNLVNRVLNIVHKKFGEVPDVDFDMLPSPDKAMLAAIDAGFKEVGDLLSSSKMRASLEKCMKLSDTVNQYLAKMEPWKEADEARAAEIMWVAVQCVADLCVLFSPFLPFSSREIYLQLGFSDERFDFQPEILDVEDLDDGHAYKILGGEYKLGVNVPRWEILRVPNGQKIEAPSPVFKKLDITERD